MRLLAIGPTTVDEDRDILGFSNPDRGVVVIATPPRAASLGWIAGEVLAALGKDNEIAPYGRRDADEREWAVTWLEAHQIRRLVFLHADWLPADLLHPLDTLAGESGCEGWFLSPPGVRLAPPFAHCACDRDACRRITCAVNSCRQPASSRRRPPRASAQTDGQR